MPALLGSPQGDTTAILDTPRGKGGAAVRYPADLGTPPFEKWILFEVKAARHLTRNGILGVSGEKGDNLDYTVKSVALYLPPDALNSSLNVTWQEDSYGTAAGAAIAQALQGQRTPNAPGTVFNADNIIPALQDAFAGAVKSGGAVIVRDALDKIGNVANKISSGSGGPLVNAENVIAGVTGSTANPRTDIFFKSVDYRTHQFGFVLIPRSLKEAQAIDEIVNIFQYYMLPSFGSDVAGARDAAFIGYPYEFVITMFSQVNGSSHHLNSIDRSVLQSISINHASNNRVSFVDEYNGVQYYPASTTINLTFKEVRLQGRNQQSVIWHGSDKGANKRPSGFDDSRNGEGIEDLAAKTAEGVKNAVMASAGNAIEGVKNAVVASAGNAIQAINPF